MSMLDPKIRVIMVGKVPTAKWIEYDRHLELASLLPRRDPIQKDSRGRVNLIPVSAIETIETIYYDKKSHLFGDLVSPPPKDDDERFTGHYVELTILHLTTGESWIVQSTKVEVQRRIDKATGDETKNSTTQRRKKS